MYDYLKYKQDRESASRSMYKVFTESIW